MVRGDRYISSAFKQQFFFQESIASLSLEYCFVRVCICVCRFILRCVCLFILPLSSLQSAQFVEYENTAFVGLKVSQNLDHTVVYGMVIIQSYNPNIVQSCNRNRKVQSVKCIQKSTCIRTCMISNRQCKWNEHLVLSFLLSGELLERIHFAAGKKKTPEVI